MKRSTVFLAASALAVQTLAAVTTVEFFYTSVLDTCQINGVYMEADGQTAHGGICAFEPNTRRIYACPAPDPTCWTWYQDCANGGSADQITCNENGATWCCAATETCTTTANQINVCISNFTSPNSGVSIATANQTELQALGISNITATTQTVDPTPFSTRTLSGTATTTGSTTNTATTVSATSTASTASTSSPSASSTGGVSSTSTSSKSSSSLSGGAIAGIVIGALAALAILAAAFFLLGRRRKSRSEKALLASPDKTDGSPYQDAPYNPAAGNTAYNGFGKNEKARYGGPNNGRASEMYSESPGVSEMGGGDESGRGRSELSGMGPGSMGELPSSSDGGGSQVRHEMP